MAPPLPPSVPNFLVAATRKSSGKTTVSLGLVRAFVNRGLITATFKKGPDYIDPLWLQLASGQPCYNLDFNTQSEAEILATFSRHSHHTEPGTDLIIIETNKGLFDGVDPRGSDSNARMASILKAPIILVIDTIGITRGIAPLLHGYSTFDPDINISGVILNKTGGSRHENKLRKAIEYYSDIPVLGSIDRNDGLAIAERHLGLTTPGEKSTAEPLIEQLAQTIEQCIDMDALLKIAASPGHVSPATPQRIEPVVRPDITIAIARDEAFGFYYPDDLEDFSRCGARLEFFSPLHDSQLPKADGLFIGGGFPETHMKKLAANQPLRAQIKTAIEAGLPTYAECGGLMYLSRSIEWSAKTAQMVGAIPGECKMHKSPQGRGFARLQNTANHRWPGNNTNPADATVPAHEFHYASIENLPQETKYAFQVKRGHGIDGNNDGVVMGNLLANFCHFRSTKRTPWVSAFTDFVRSCAHADRK